MSNILNNSINWLKKSSANIVSIGRIFFVFIAVYLIVTHDTTQSFFVTKQIAKAES